MLNSSDASLAVECSEVLPGFRPVRAQQQAAGRRQDAAQPEARLGLAWPREQFPQAPASRWPAHLDLSEGVESFQTRCIDLAYSSRLCSACGEYVV